ncbi:hypothetical protein GGS26DRAFT_10151 [Hypomontagnella submonticulosa]|nr:hypothetical protein GGS26DRAFT_10151 [Hypomontagnella submonticulosa]
MADQPRRRRNRPDSKQMWDESDRHSRHDPNVRDRKDDRVRDREDSHRDRDRDRDRRYRSRSRSPRRDRRDNARDRRDRNRDRDVDKGRGREDDRARPRGDEYRERDHDKKGRDRRRDWDEPPAKGMFYSEQEVARNAFGVKANREAAPARDRSPRRSASPPRSPAKNLDRGSHSNSPLPTRPRPSAAKTEPSALQFKVGAKHDDEAQRGDKGKAGSQFRDARGSPSEESEDRKRRAETPTSQHGDAMDEDNDDGDDVVVEDDGLSAMQAMMGFGGFGTTKGAHVPGNNAGAVRKEKKTEYRQYMNRVGGFNRPLSPTR